MSQQVQIPKEIAEFIDVVAERYGYYVAKRLTLKDMMEKSKAERADVKAKRVAVESTNDEIRGLFGEYISKGTDVREQIINLSKKLDEEASELENSKANLKAVTKPFYDKIKPLNKALSHLDKVVIPERLEAITGKPITPRFTVSKWLLQAISKPKKK